MGASTCYRHNLRYNDDAQCPECAEERSAENDADAGRRASEASPELQRRRTAEEGVCNCCGQRFIERTRVRQAGHKPWTGALARHTEGGVCPACANKHGAY